MDFAELLETRAQEKGEETFLFFGDERVSYAELDRRANCIANGLAGLGVGPGVGVAIMMGNSPTWLATFFATQKLGGYAVPVNVALRGEGLAYVLDHSESQALVIGADLVEAFAPLQAGLARLRHVIVDTSAAPLGVALPAGALPIESFAAASTGRPPAKAVPDTTAILLYTSGTTGLPKAVVVRHGAFNFAGLYLFAQLGYRPGDILYTCLPLFHANALFLTTMQGLYSGYPVALGRRFSASRFWDEVRRYGATTFNALGAMIPILLKQPPRPDDRDNPVRLVFSAATPAAAWEEFERRFDVTIWEGYGAVDGGGFMLFNFGNGPKGSMGLPPPGTEARVFRDDGSECEAGEAGELVFKVDDAELRRVAYLKNEEASNAKIRNGWFYTGDLAWRDAQGFFYFADRKSDSIRRRGENISSFEVEKIVDQHPAVLESAAFGVPSELGEDDVMVVVACKPGAAVAPEELVAFCTERMAKFMVPRHIEFADSIPKTETHRVQKQLLKRAGITPNTWDREKTAK
ncbi:MAG: AMP-binding protein [Candidatus Binatia bacterium]|jgi:carnitine-CoA ligase